MTPISIFGLGIIGSRVARHLRKQHVPLTVWNRTPRLEFVNRAVSPAEAAGKSRILAFYLKDRQACMEVFSAIKAELTPQHTILNHSTIDPETVMELAASCRETGCTYIDAPFTGSKLAAEAGQLVYYVAGDEDKINDLRPYLDLSSKAILYTGAIGTAAILKLITNMISATMVQGLSEGLAIAKAYGISGNQLLDVINVNFIASPLANFKLPLMAKGDFSPHFSLDNMFKDSTYCLKIAHEKGLELPAASLVNSIMDALRQKGKADEDFSVLSSQFSQQ